MTPELLTGREPRLSDRSTHQGRWRLSSQRLTEFLASASPHAISLEAAEAMLRHESFGIRYNAARMLRERGDREARLIAQRVLADGAPLSRASVARHLAGFSWFAAEPLLRQAFHDLDPRVREAAIYALCDFASLHAYQMLKEILPGETDFVRMAAAWGLRERQDPETVTILGIVLQAEDPEVRVKALEVLGANGVPGADRLAFDTMSHDPDPDVQYAATLSTLELQKEQALETIVPVIQQAEGASRVAILRGFFHATNYLKIKVAEHPSADALLDAIEMCLQDASAVVRQQAIWIPAWMDTPRSVEIVCTAYEREPDSRVKAHFLRTIVSLMSPAAGTLWQQALTSDDPILREAAEILVEEHAQQFVSASDAAPASG